MAATFDFTVARKMDDAGIRRRVVGKFTGDASYLQASGTTINPADIGLGRIEKFHMPIISNNSTTIYFSNVQYNSNGSVTIFFYSATATLVGNGDLSTFNNRFEALGK